MDDNFYSAVSKPAQTTLFPLPPEFADRVVIDFEKLHAYVDKSAGGDPKIHTWISRNKDRNIPLVLKIVDISEIHSLKSSGLRSISPGIENEDDELAMRKKSLDLIRKAADYGSSDIHIMLWGKYCEIQIFYKGGLRVLDRTTQEEGESIIRTIYQSLAKIRAGGFNALEFQDAQISSEDLPSDIKLTSIRIVRGPAYPMDKNGAFMTMRLQYPSSKLQVKKDNLPTLSLPKPPEGTFDLEHMGWDKDQIKKIEILMNDPDGIVILTGPTGSGKTTVIYQAFLEMGRRKPHRRGITIEDPIEYPMDGKVQMAITNTGNDAEKGKAFSERVRVGLRMAPHYFLIGEIRGPDVAVSAIEASITGHSVWTTLHVNDPYLAIERLEFMDGNRLNRKIICDHKIIRGLIATRLLPKLCPHCSTALHKSPTAIDASIIEALSTWGDTSSVRVRGNGCEHCGHDGVTERFGVAEVVLTSVELMSDFIHHGTAVARTNHRARPGSDIPMMERAIKLCLEGLVDPRAIQESIDRILPKDFKG